MTSVGTVISFPIPLYQNLPIEPQFYTPSRFVIQNIVLGYTTTITTTENMNYVIGQEIRLLIPASFGSYQLNNAQGFVIDIPADDQVTVTINSINADAFTTSNATTVAQILAIGDVNNGYISSTAQNVPNPGIPGSFQDISP